MNLSEYDNQEITTCPFAELSEEFKDTLFSYFEKIIIEYLEEELNTYWYKKDVVRRLNRLKYYKKF